jgi:hypothetical protein
MGKLFLYIGYVDKKGLYGHVPSSLTSFNISRIMGVLYFKAQLKLNVDFDPMMIGADTRDSCLEKRVKGDPAG